MNALHILLPPLVGTRSRARALAEPLPDSLAGSEIVVDGTNLMAATISFADELIKQLLVQRDAARMVLVNISDEEFGGWMATQAAANNVDERLTVRIKGVSA